MPRSSVARSHPVHPCRGYSPGREDKSADNKPEVWRVAVRLGLQVRSHVILDLLRPPVAVRADCQQHAAERDFFRAPQTI